MQEKSMFKKILLFLISEIGEDGEGNNQSGSGDEGSAEGQGQGDQNASSQDGNVQSNEGQEGDGQQENVQQGPTLQEQFEEMKSAFEMLKGQSGATERNLAMERKALESMGLKVVRDTQGNVQVVPANQNQNSNSRFNDARKNEFLSYFPDQKSGEKFLEILEARLEDFADNRFQKYDQEKSTASQFQDTRKQSVEKMYQLFPSLDEKSESFDKSFYNKANELYVSRYKNIPNGDLIAAHETAIEMGISPAAVQNAKKEGFQKGQNIRKIVGGSSSQSQNNNGGFRRLSFDEFKKLSPEKREEYNKKEIESRGK